MNILRFVLCGLVACCALGGEETCRAEAGTRAGVRAWREGFERGPGGARPYHKTGPRTTLEVVRDQAAEGQRFLRASLPGTRRLEGLNLSVSGLIGGRLATASAKVRGKGDLWLCLHSGNGWLYSPQTVSLTKQWQGVSLDKVLKTGDGTLSVHFLSKQTQPGAVFEVDDVQLVMTPPPQTYDVEAGPWRLEAEAFASRPSCVARDKSASGGKVALDRKHILLSSMPFPRTCRPVTVTIRVKPGAKDEDYRLITTQGGCTQGLSVIKPEAVGQWQWLAFDQAFAGEYGSTFGIEFRAKGVAAEPTAMDAVVVSTQAGLGGAALDRVPALLSHYPLALVSRCAAGPKLDGEGQDACWQNTVGCTDFVVVRSQAAAKAGTAARFCYDKTHLYALFVCKEPVLDVRAQRRHEFLARAKTHDAKVSRDDACVMLLDPSKRGTEAYDVFVNAFGTIQDARCAGPNLWEGREIAWDSKAKAAGRIGDGSWAVEVAIPFADLTGKTPEPGDVWHACLGRIAQSRRESSSWNPANPGFHAPAPWGALVFGGPTPGVSIRAPSRLTIGKNPLTATFSPLADRPRGVYLMSTIGLPTGVRRSYDFRHISDTPVEVTQHVKVEQEGRLQVACGVLDAGTLQPLYLTPLLMQAVKSTTAKVRLACDGPYELFVNAERVGRGQQADVAEIAVPLQKGANVFALKLAKGTAAVRIDVPGLAGDAGNWRIGGADVKDAAAASVDDASWATAQRVGEHPELGPVIGKPGSPVVLRQTLLWQKTRIWPTPDAALHIARNSNQHVTVIADGLPARKLLDWTVYLAVPPTFKILGSTGYYGRKVAYQPEFVCTQLGQRVVAGQTMRVATIRASKPVIRGRHRIMSLFNVFVRHGDEAREPPGTETRLVYWTEANDRTVVEPPQVIPVRILPALNGRQPDKLVFQLWGSFFSAMDDVDMRVAALETMRAAGINDLVGGDRWTSDHAPRYGMRHTLCVNFQPWSLKMQAYLKQHPDERLIDRDAKPNGTYLCMTRLLDTSWQAVAAKLKEKIDAIRPHTIDYDYEYPPFGPPHACYCPRCLRAFCEYAGLPTETQLTPQVIRSDYEDQWVDFMAWRVAQMFGKFKDEIHRAAPGTRFSVYSGYQSRENPRQYGVDWRYVGKVRACDRIGCGYGRPVARIPKTIEAVGDIPAVFGALLHPYDAKDVVPLAPLTKARLLRRCLDATGGVLIYDRLPLDGRCWFAVAETTRLAAGFEEVFLVAKRSSLAGLHESQVQLLRHGKLTLVCVMNDTSKQVTSTISLPEGTGRGREFYGGATVAGGQTVECVLPPGETAVYVLRK